MRILIALFLALTFVAPLAAEDKADTASTNAKEPNKTDALAPWRSGVTIKLAVPRGERHTIHSYYTTCPESPDGSKLLYYASTTANGHQGVLCVLDRASGKESVIAENIATEDAHRAACQQWVCNAKQVVYHVERDKLWQVVAVDLASGKERVLAPGRLLGWGQPTAGVVPVYGPHWAPGEHRDLELVDVETSAIKKVLKAAEVREKCPDWLQTAFGDRPVSIFFPVMSPDLSRVFFKLATPAGGDARSKQASTRQGIVVYDLANKKFLYSIPRWGHPSWHTDGRTIVEMGNFLYNSDNGEYVRIPGVPAFRGDHPTASPDGQMIVTDTTLEKFGGTQEEWGIVLYDPRGNDHLILHRFDNSGGAKSWRRSHPHPSFSPDGKRIYFNVSTGPWTQLYMAERKK